MNSKLSKGVLIIFITNIINMAFSLITNFILPKYLSYEAYSIIKTFQLYVSYIGLFHLGYSDGVYLHYGGRELNKLDKNKLQVTVSTMRGFQLFVAFCVALFSLYNHNILILIFSLDIFSYNLVGLFKNIYQAVGEFKNYAKINNIITVFNFILNMSLIIIVKSDNPYLYILGYMLVDTFAWVLLEIKTCHLLNIKFDALKLSIKELVSNIKDGILLLFGNLTSILITSLDRWFTKILLSTFDFAHYSFAVSIENFLNVAITPVTITLYNYLCKNQNVKDIRKLKNTITIFAVSLVAAYFPVKFILEVYLDKYIDSAVVIAFLFASQMFYIIIKSIYVNLYKARMQQKRYFIKVLMVIVAGFLLNIIMFKIRATKESFAIGTLLSSIIWFIICQIDFKEIRSDFKEITYQAIELVLFLLCAIRFNSLKGLVIYVVMTLIITYFLNREGLFKFFKIILSMIKK